MRLNSPWTPRLAEGVAPPSDRLVAALADDILEGRISTGDRLPAHRDLANKLGIGVGTVTKAYGLLERRGLVRSVKGSGTFVALAQTRRGPLIDLSRNVPPAVMSERLLASTFLAMAKRVDSGLFNDYPPLGGHEEHRRLLARWFARLGVEAAPRRLVLTGGAHQAIALALPVTCGTGGVLFTEAQTYPGVFALARHHGIRCVGVEMDGEGIVPEALDRALAAKKAGPTALYVTPTMQNPTTATMGRARREAIVSVCRAHDIAIIEDDVYTLAADASLPPLAMLAPERTFYANGLSKTLNPALRIGGLVVPESMYQQIETALQATTIMVPPLSCAVMEQWLLDGTVEAMSRAIQDESKRRIALARSMLGGLMYPSSPKTADGRGYHVWLPMPQHEAQRLAHAASALGVLVTPPASTAADPDAPDGGVRLCLGAASIAELSTALAGIARLRIEVRQPDPQLAL